MTFARTAISAAIVSAVLVASGSYAANASVPASATECLRMGKKVQDALEANASSPKAFEAKQQWTLGRDFCNSHIYDKGVDHYAKALELLGAG